MKSIWQTIFIATAISSLVACGSDNNPKPLLNEGPIEILFPLGHSTTTSDSVTVKGRIAHGVNALVINGIEADFNQSDEFWFATVPVSDSNTTKLSFTYEDAKATYAIESDITIDKSDVYLQNANEGSVVEFADTLYFDESSSNTIFVMNKDGSNIRSLWNYRTHSFSGVDSFNLDENMKISADGSEIFIVVDGRNESEDMDTPMLISLSTSTGEPTIMYGPDSNGYQVFNHGQLAYMPSMGTAGQLILTHSGTNTIPNIFDLSTQTMSDMNIDALNDLTGGLVYTKVYNLSVQGDSSLRLIGSTRPNNTWHFWSAELDLSACDGEPESCRLATSSLKIETDFTGCISPLDGLRVRDGMFHNESQRWIYSSYSNDYSELCILNLEDYSLSSATIETESDEYRNKISFTENLALLTVSREILLSPLPSSFDGSAITFTEFNQVPVIGDESISLQTAREVRINNTTNRAYWMDRDLGKVHQLDLATWEWTTIFELDDEVLGQDEAPTRPEFRPEESALDESNNTLYLVSDSRNSIFAINLESGEYEVVVAYEQSAANPTDLYDINAIALDTERGLIYIANERVFDDTRTAETEFNLLAYNIENQQLSVVSDTTLIADHPLQESMKASYDMTFDQDKDRVYFYSSSSSPNDPIWAVDVTNGERSIISFDYSSDWTTEECLADMDAEQCAKTQFIGQPRLSNARGHEMDNANGRMLIASQDSDSVLSMDTTSGIITNLSPEDFSYGPLLTSPKGIDLIGDSNVALVSDESMDALFLVDTDSGQRVLIHNQ